MRADRLLSILLTLQLHGRTTAKTLAARLEVSERTIYRDVDALCTAGVPVFTERGREGGFALVDGYRTDLTGLSATEAGALPFVGLDAAAAALGIEHIAEGARLKVFAALTPTSQARANQMKQCFYVDPAGWYRRTAAPNFLQAVAEATWSHTSITIDYESWTHRKARNVDPLGLVLKAGEWYLVAQIPIKANIQSFRLDRIRNVRSLEIRFVRPIKFDLGKHWRDQVTRFERSLRRLRATLRISPTAMYSIDTLGADAIEAIHAAKPDDSGWREASIWIESIGHATTLLLGFAADIEVMSPESLRAELALRASKLCLLYGWKS